MAGDLLLFAQLLVFLVGTFVYGFLARELARHRDVLPGNRPLRLLAGALLVWYAGCLLDELLGILAPPPPPPAAGATLATLLDVARGAAWLATFPLLAHAVWRLLPARREGAGSEGAGEALRPHALWLLPAYATLLLFVPQALAAWSARSAALAASAHAVFPLFVLHSTVGAAAAALFIARARRASEDPGTQAFLRGLQLSIALVVLVNAAAALLVELWPELSWVEPAWLLSTVASGLLPGLTFLWFVQRVSLLRLSLSFRSLRHFAAVLLLVLLAMLAGPAAGAQGSDAFRRLVAWGLVAALAAGALGRRVSDALTRRSAWLRRLLGRAFPPEEMDRLSARIHSLEGSERELLDLVAGDVGRLLGARARFLAADEQPELRAWLASSDGRAFSRLDPPSAALARRLARAGLEAVFPLRAGSDLAGVLALEGGAAAGGPGDGERESVTLLLRQLGAALAVRREVEARLAAERRQGEQERLSMLGLVAASLAHELKNPLAAMKALAQTVEEEARRAAPASDQARDLAIVVEQIERLHEVAREILAFARPREGSEVELLPLVRSALYVLDQEARRKGVLLARDGLEDVGVVPGSPAAWQTVVFNLALNAVRHAPDGSRVEVRLARGDGEVAFETRNGGPAIPGALAARLFTPFATTDGVGLGLALVAARARDLGGRVELENAAGSVRFRVRVPDAEGAPRPVEPAAAAAAAREDG